MDAIVEKTLADALAQITAAAFAIESVAHLRGMERTLLPIAEPLRAQQAALQAVIATAAVVPDVHPRRRRPRNVLPDPEDRFEHGGPEDKLLKRDDSDDWGQQS
jgi:hypothetical protein